MDDEIPVTVRMRVECARCGHAEDDTFEFDMSCDNSEPMAEAVPGKCPECGARVVMHLSRTQQVQ
jgi:ribosomal protein S27AE